MEYVQYIVTIVIILLIFYVANYAKKKQDEDVKKMQSAIKENDKIVTYTGLAGVVSKVLEDRVIVKLYPNETEVSIEKWAIAGLDDRTITDDKEAENKENKKNKESKKIKEIEKNKETENDENTTI